MEEFAVPTCQALDYDKPTFEIMYSTHLGQPSPVDEVYSVNIAVSTLSKLSFLVSQVRLATWKEQVRHGSMFGTVILLFKIHHNLFFGELALGNIKTIIRNR